MKIILHDLLPEQWEKLALSVAKDDLIVTGNGDSKYCIGCFGCWLKTPGRCVIADQYQQMGERLSEADELLIISRCTFGSYSSVVKNILDRSISYVSPFFVIRNREMHHKPRYQNTITLSAIFYGEDITDAEKETARSLVEANAVNLNGRLGSIEFREDAL